MPDFDDLTIRSSSAEPPGLPPPRRGVVPVIAVLAALAAAGGWYWWRSSREPAAPPEPTAARSSPAPAAPADSPLLPPLDAMDPLVRQLVSALSSHPTVAAWLTTDDLVRNFVVSVQNVSDGATPRRHLQPIAPASGFRVMTKNGQPFADPRAYQRYDAHADAVGALDAEGVARLYTTLRPRLDEAYKEIDPAGSFDAALRRAIASLLATPAAEDPVRLEADGGLYRFADPVLEGLTPAQRQLLRMGPRNQRIVQAKLKEIADRLGSPAERRQ